MPRGRPKTPTAVQRRRDNPGKRKLPEPLLVAPATAPLPAPQDLPEEGRELWDDVVHLLYEARVIETVDRAALKAMCVQWAIAERSLRVLREDGYFATGSMGQIVEHPALAIVSKAHAMFLRFAQEYALTAAARARIAATITGVRAGGELDDIIDAEPEEL